MTLCNMHHLELKYLSFSKEDKERTFGCLYNMFIEQTYLLTATKDAYKLLFGHLLFFLMWVKYEILNVKLVSLWTFPLGLPVKRWYNYFQICMGLILVVCMCVCVLCACEHAKLAIILEYLFSFTTVHNLNLVELQHTFGMKSLN